MEQILINLVAGALGGVGAGKSSPTFDLGTIGNVISGLIGGGVLGQIVTLSIFLCSSRPGSRAASVCCPRPESRTRLILPLRMPGR